MNFESIKKSFKDCIAYINVAADHKDVKKNFIQFGRLQVFADVLQDMGHTIDGSIVEDDEKGIKRVVYMTLDGQKVGEYSNNASRIFGLMEGFKDANGETEDQDETEEKD